MTEHTLDDIDTLLRSKAHVHDLNPAFTTQVVNGDEAESPPEPEPPKPTPLPGGAYAPVHAPPSLDDWIRKEVRVLKYGADPRRGY